MLLSLPPEIWGNILKNCSVADLVRFYYSSKKYRYLLKHPEIWHTVNLTPIYKFTKGLWHVLEECGGPYIKLLGILGEHSIRDMGAPLYDLLKPFRNVTQLDVSGCTLMSRMDFVLNMPKLTHLVMDYCHIDPLDFMVNHYDSEVIYFSYRGNHGAIPSDVRFLAHSMHNLRYLDVRDTHPLRPYDVRSVLMVCENLKVFYFTMQYDPIHRADWIRLFFDYKDVKFSKEVYRQMFYFLKL